MASIVNVLISGGAGFLGAHLAEGFLEEGHRVVVFDDLSRPGAERVARRLNDRFDSTALLSFVFRDVRDAGEVGRAVAGMDVVIHAAAAGTDEAVALDPTADFQIRVGGTLTLLEAIRTRAPEAHFVLPSSLAVYGAAPVIEQRLTIAADERFKALPHASAGASALSAEAYAHAYSKSHGVKTTVLRFATLYGANDLVEDEGWVGRFISAATLGGTFTAPVALPFPVDVVHIDDAVRAVLAVTSMSNVCAGQIFNVGGGARSAPSLRQVAARIEELGGTVRMSPPDPASRPSFVLDPRKLRSVTGWQPAVGWKEGLARAMGAMPSPDPDDLWSPETADNNEPRPLVAFPRAEGLA